MLDNLLIKEIIVAINQGMTERSLTIPVKQKYQPTQQGVNSQPTLYLHKIGDRRYGFPKRSDVYDEDNEVMVHTESEYYETTFQLSALAIQDPTNINSITASDICNITTAILQSDSARAYLKSKDISILRITDVRNPYFVDDKDRFEASPSFDFILIHEQVTIGTTPVVETIEYNINRV